MSSNKPLTIEDMPKQVLVQMMKGAFEKEGIPESYLADKLINHKGTEINRLVPEHNELREQLVNGTLKGRAKEETVKKVHGMNNRIFKLVDDRKTLIKQYFPEYAEKEATNDSN